MNREKGQERFRSRGAEEGQKQRSGNAEKNCGSVPCETMVVTELFQGQANKWDSIETRREVKNRETSTGVVLQKGGCYTH